MATIRLRFSGRFVLAESPAGGKRTGELHALALKMSSDTAQNRHRAVMSVARMNLSDTQAPNFLGAGLCIVGPTKDKPIEHLIWDLAGWNVTVGGTGSGFSWNDPAGPKLPNLSTLEQVRHKKASFKSAHLRSRTAAVSSAIRVRSGIGSAPLTSSKEYDFAPRNDAETPLVTGERFADFVDVVIEDSELSLEMVKRSNPSVKRSVKIEVPKAPDLDEAVIRFSNLCPALVTGSNDPEFAEYYGLFTHDAQKNELLIAKETPHIGEMGTGCYLMVHTRLRRA